MSTAASKSPTASVTGVKGLQMGGGGINMQGRYPKDDPTYGPSLGKDLPCPTPIYIFIYIYICIYICVYIYINNMHTYIYIYIYAYIYLHMYTYIVHAYIDARGMLQAKAELEQAQAALQV